MAYYQRMIIFDEFYSTINRMIDSMTECAQKFIDAMNAMNEAFNIEFIDTLNEIYDIPIILNRRNEQRKSNKYYRIMMDNKYNTRFKNYHVYNILKNLPYQRRSF